VLIGVCPVCGAQPPAHAVVCPHDGTELVSAEGDPLLGTVVGTYKVLRRLGIGGMGAVYEGREVNIDKRAALKIVHPHLSADPRLPSVLAEAKAVNAIGDEGIVDIYGFGTLPDGQPYLVMELLEGESLEARLARQKKLSVQEAIALMVPLLQALEAAHAAGFVHRDIKSANVFIVERPNRAPFPKLLDFGIAQSIKAGATDALGTPGYVSPEQADNVNVGAKADLYSVGVLLFEMLSGRLPFDDADWQEQLRKHREAPRPSLKGLAEVPEALDALVRGLMSVEPRLRPASAAAVRASLLQLREELTPKRRSRAGLAAGLGAGVLALVAFLVLRQPPPAVPVPVGPTPAAEDPVAKAAAAAAADVEAQLAKSSIDAVEPLLAGEAAFPKRPAWEALRGKVSAALRLSAQGALAKDDAEGAQRALTALSKLAPLPKGDPLEAQVHRVSFALRSGMVRVGEVFIDRYEHPNRAGVLPTTKVDWAEAVKLCEGAGKHLCSEQEWETACRGAAHLTFPYGPKYEKGRCLSKSPRARGPVAAGARKGCVGEAGVFDLSGNVAEWTSTPVREDAPQRVTRGGSYFQSDAKLSCEARDYALPGLGGAAHLGLRCCL
jgi:tRNA A-37 threonylcarbamoyl transferase component Bud32